MGPVHSDDRAATVGIEGAHPPGRGVADPPVEEPPRLRRAREVARLAHRKAALRKARVVGELGGVPLPVDVPFEGVVLVVPLERLPGVDATRERAGVGGVLNADDGERHLQRVGGVGAVGGDAVLVHMLPDLARAVRDGADPPVVRRIRAPIEARRGGRLVLPRRIGQVRLVDRVYRDRPGDRPQGAVPVVPEVPLPVGKVGDLEVVVVAEADVRARAAVRRGELDVRESVLDAARVRRVVEVPLAVAGGRGEDDAQKLPVVARAPREGGVATGGVRHPDHAVRAVVAVGDGIVAPIFDGSQVPATDGSGRGALAGVGPDGAVRLLGDGVPLDKVVRADLREIGAGSVATGVDGGRVDRARTVPVGGGVARLALNDVRRLGVLIAPADKFGAAHPPAEPRAADLGVRDTVGLVHRVVDGKPDRRPPRAIKREERHGRLQKPEEGADAGVGSGGPGTVARGVDIGTGGDVPGIGGDGDERRQEGEDRQADPSE